MSEISSVIPACVMARLLWLEDDVFDRFCRWGTAFMLSADLTPEEREGSNIDLVEYFQNLVTLLDAALSLAPKRRPFCSAT